MFSERFPGVKTAPPPFDADLRSGDQRFVRLLRLMPLTLLVIASRASATSAPTIYESSQMYPLGSRAAGMGGAYTALACDEAALHYNPAALGCAGRTRVELAANAYMLQHFNAPDSLGPGQDITATSYHPLPSIAGFVRILSEGDPESGIGRIGAGLSVSVPRSIFLAVDPPNPEKKDFFSITVRDDLLAGDVGFGWQIARTLAIGASIGGVMRTYQSHTGLLLVKSSPSPCGGGACFDYVATSQDQELLAIGGRAKLALRWTPASALSFGLVLTSPVIDVYGSAKSVSATTVALTQPDQMGNPVAGYAAVPDRVKGSSNLSLPARIAVGAALQLPSLLLSLDLSVALPRQVRVAYDLEPIMIEGLAPPEEPIPDDVLNLALQPNVAVGAELELSDGVVLDLGFFTDLSSTSDEDLAADNADRIHMFGGTVALGLIGKQARSWFGLSFEIGSGTTLVRSQELSFEQIVMGEETNVESSYTRWNVIGILGSSYSFIDDEDVPSGK